MANVDLQVPVPPGHGDTSAGNAATQIPAKHKGVVYDNPGTLSTKLVELDTPEPGPGQVLINLTHSGVCHSDMSVMLNGWATLPLPTPAGQVGGHEGVGTVVKLGAGADATIALGDRVGVKWLSSVCGGCAPCLEGHDGICFKQEISGYMTPGTFQQYVLGPANYVTPIPKELDSAAAAPMLCGGVTVYAALRKSGAIAGNTVAIMGAAGGLGHLAVQIASRGFGLRVLALDHSSKKEFATACGAEHFVAFDQVPDVPTAVKETTGGLGVHAVLVLTASNAAYAQAMDMLRFGGTVVCVGMPEGDMKPIAHAFPLTMVAMETRIVGSAVGTRRDAIAVLDMAARGIVKTEFTTRKMEDLSEIFETMSKGQLKGRVVLDLS